jgi:hypothetical protein
MENQALQYLPRVYPLATPAITVTKTMIKAAACMSW